MRLALVVLFMLGLVDPATGAAATCRPEVILLDRAGDVTFMGQENRPAEPPAALDVLVASLKRGSEDLELSVDLAEPPPFGSNVDYFRYWFGYHVAVDGGEPLYMNLRVAGDNRYDQGYLVGPNDSGSGRVGTYPVAWAGAQASFRIPILDLVDFFGSADLEFGKPRGGADGPSHSSEVQGSVAGAVFAEYYGDLEDFKPVCQAVASVATQAVPVAARSVEGWRMATWALVLALPALVFGGFWLGRRGR